MMNEFNQEEVSRARAERSNKALRNLCLGAAALTGIGVAIEAVTPSLAVTMAVILVIGGVSAHLNLRKVRGASEQE